MEKETIIVQIEIKTPAGENPSTYLSDNRRIVLKTTRGEITKKVDEVVIELLKYE